MTGSSTLKRPILWLALSLALLFAVVSSAAEEVTITYISSEGVYLNAGTKSGVAIGDTLAIRRDQTVVARIVITYVAGNSASGTILTQDSPLQVGDQVLMARVAPDASADAVVPAQVPETTALPTSGRRRVRADIAVQNYWRQDMTGSGLSSMRPGLRAKLTISNVANTGATLTIRHRTRLYHRSSQIREGQKKNEWTHRVYELSLAREGRDYITEWGVGRIVVPYVRGVGFVDGGFVAHQVRPGVRVGLAAGTSPDYQNSSVDLNRRRVGAFVAYESGDYTTGRFSLSAAVSTEYEKSTVSREFFYLQGVLSGYKHVTLHQSVEIDLNRNWRYDRTNKRLSLTNYFGSLNLKLRDGLSVYCSYDTRKNIRSYETRDLADSLFDDSSHRGLRTGLSARLSNTISTRLSGGVRFREGETDNNWNGAASVRLSHFPYRRHSITAYLNVVETQFTTGYRPVLSYRFPVSRQMYINLSTTAYVYKTGSNTTSYYYSDVATSYYFTNGYYLSGSYRQYFDSSLQSAEIYTELGMRL